MPKFIKIPVIVLPSALSVVWMILVLCGTDLNEFDPYNTVPAVTMAACIVLFTLLNFLVPQWRRDFLELAVLSPSFIAPMAVTGLWALTPGTLSGIGFGGFEYFVHWLTKYPDFGPVNIKILAGMLCILGTFFIPAFFSVYSAAVKKPRLLHLFFFMVAYLVVYTAVFFRLDLLSWTAILGQIGNPNVLFLVSAPLFRLLPLVFMPAFAFLSYFIKNREPDEPSNGNTNGGTI